MRMKSINHMFFLFSGLFILSLVQGCNAHLQPTNPGGKAPVITNSYAIEKGRYGNVLKIYIEADDPDNDMVRIATVVEQPGFGRYPTDWVFLKSPTRGHFAGYLRWDTSSAHTGFLSEWTSITIKVSVLDKTGRESNVVVFPFEFVSEVVKNPAPPAPFDQGNIPVLGNIIINLYEPSRIGGDGNLRPFD
jgi:hypothetical protein